MFVELTKQVSANNIADKRSRTYVGESRNCADNVSGLVHHNVCTRAQTRLSIFQRVEVHPENVWLAAEQDVKEELRTRLPRTP